MDFFERLQQETAQERGELYNLPVLVDAAQGRVTREMHLAHLEQAYHHVKNTLPLLLLMASRLPKDREWLRRELVKYADEETGHEDWILDDIKKLGGNPEAVKSGAPGLAVELMNAFNYDVITRVNPMGYFGMIFVLENTSVALASKAVEGLQKALGADKDCFSYLNSHGDLDIEHTQFIGKLLNKITDPKDQAIIVHASKVIYHLYTDMFRNIQNNYAKQAA